MKSTLVKNLKSKYERNKFRKLIPFTHCLVVYNYRMLRVYSEEYF
jgi:hypothetical protein